MQGRADPRRWIAVAQVSYLILGWLATVLELSMAWMNRM